MKKILLKDIMDNKKVGEVLDAWNKDYGYEIYQDKDNN